MTAVVDAPENHGSTTVVSPTSVPNAVFVRSLRQTTDGTWRGSDASAPLTLPPRQESRDARSSA